jgi:hypothetical protein
MKAMSAEWTRTYENGSDYIESLGGVTWNAAPLPLPWHRCRTQTRGWIGPGYVERCPCGATRLSPAGLWLERNQTRKSRARKRREDRLPRARVTCRECGRPYEAAEGTRIAEQRQCGNCWAEMFIASGGERT